MKKIKSKKESVRIGVICEIRVQKAFFVAVPFSLQDFQKAKLT
jgi:hypothetical protein